MATSTRHIPISLVVLSWLAAGCSSSKKVDLGADCLLNSDCNPPLSCSFGKCHTTCVQTRDCPLGQSCVRAPEGSVCQFPADSDCQATGGVCAGGLVCAADQRCRSSCQAAAECLAGQLCADGTCAESASVDSSGHVKSSGRVGTSCVSDGDCASPLSCVLARCHYLCQSTSLCPTGQSCVRVATTSVCQGAAEAACNDSMPCVGNLVCAVDYRCRAACRTASDCTVGQKCASGVCADSGDLNASGQLTPKNPPVIPVAGPDAPAGDGGNDAALDAAGASEAGPPVATGGSGGSRSDGAAGEAGTGDIVTTGGAGGIANRDASLGAGGNSMGGTGGTVPGLDGGATAGIVWYVDQASAGGDGKSWSGAFATLQSALTNAQLRSGDQIWIAKGTYTPAASGGSRTTYFYLVNGVALYGGFHGTEAKLGDRDNPVDSSLTVLSGDIGANDGVDAKGALTNRTDNSHHVVVGASNGVLDGLTITGGNANGTAGEQQQGGGMYNLLCEGLRVANVRFVLNLAAGSGGGLYNAPGSYTTQELTHVVFAKNQAGNEGGGFYNGNGNAKLTDVVFVNNSGVYGGGMSSSGGAPLLDHVFLVGNTAYSSGSGNGVDGRGGGLYIGGGNLRVTNATFGGNSAISARGAFTPNGWGGGLFITGGSPSVANAVFSGNTVSGWNGSGTGYGGGIMVNGGTPAVTNVTITGNATGNGAGVYRGAGTPKLTNVVLWGNGIDTTVSEVGGSAIAFSRSDIRACGGSSAWTITCGTDGGGNIDTATSPFATYRAASGSWTDAPTYSADRLQTTFTNRLAPWVAGELAGMFIRPDTSQARRLPILANTGTTMTVWGDAASSAAAGTMYSVSDVRLASGSGCIDTGDTAALPADSGDVDHDGNTSEAIPWDLGDQPRVVNGTVDMGAYELQ